jgi:chemotaxis protein CheD
LKVFLKPGELYIGTEPAIISTILGSCLSITMFNTRLRLGGICHALFPTDPKQAQGKEFCYVDGSVSYMLNEFGKMGIKKNEIEVKAFGGANIIDATYKKSVGQANIEAVFNIIKDEGLKMLTHDLGGTLGRKIIFSTHTGRVLLKKLERMRNT